MIWFLACATPPTAPATDTAPPYATLTGRLDSAAGEPVPDVTPQACAHVCVVAFTDTDGRFTVDLPVGWWSLKVVATEPAQTPAVFPILLEADRDIVLAVPSLGDPVPVPDLEAWVEVAPGFEVLASAPALPGVPHIAGAPVVPWPPLDGVDGVPVAGYHLSPAGVGMDLPYRLGTPNLAAWCSGEDGQPWVACTGGALPRFGTIVFTMEDR